MNETIQKKLIKNRWIKYYSRKRVIHQWMQVNLINKVDVEKILEIGPAMGGVTALLSNAGYDVTTLDRVEPNFDTPKTPHIKKNILDLDPQEIAGFEAIICCETLEHIAWNDVPDTLRKFHESGAKYLLISVPYMGFQLTFDFYFNLHKFRSYFSWKKLLFLKKFEPEPEFGHQWEVGYRGHSLKAWESRIEQSGYSIVEREFTEHCRSVFHLLERK